MPRIHGYEDASFLTELTELVDGAAKLAAEVDGAFEFGVPCTLCWLVAAALSMSLTRLNDDRFIFDDSSKPTQIFFSLMLCTHIRQKILSETRS